MAQRRSGCLAALFILCETGRADRFSCRDHRNSSGDHCRDFRGRNHRRIRCFRSRNHFRIRCRGNCRCFCRRNKTRSRGIRAGDRSSADQSCGFPGDGRLHCHAASRVDAVPPLHRGGSEGRGTGHELHQDQQRLHPPDGQGGRPGHRL